MAISFRSFRAGCLPHYNKENILQPDTQCEQSLERLSGKADEHIKVWDMLRGLDVNI